MSRKMPVEPHWQRLNTLGKPVAVDRQAKVIRGYIVAEKGPFKSAGRGEFDDRSLSLIVQLMQAKGLPVMVQTVEPDGYRIEEVLSIESKPVSASLFAAPKNFKKITGTEVLDQMMGGGPPPAQGGKPQGKPKGGGSTEP